MNVLLFVTSLLMILSLLTYAKVDGFRYFLGMEAQFETYMSSIERSYTNEIAVQWFKTIYGNKERNRNDPPKQPPHVSSSPRLSFRVFIDEKEREKNPYLFANTTKWAKDLMRSLYGEQNFFKEAEMQNPYFMDLLLERLSAAAAQLPKDQKLKNAIDLSNLELGPDVESIFYLMLKGCVREIDTSAKTQFKETEEFIITLEDDNSQEDEIEIAEEALEYVGAKGYDSLLNYITLRNTTKIKVYLASRPLLQILVGDRAVVENIIETRNSLYQAVIKGSMQPELATEQFKLMFQSYLGNGDDTYLDFNVTKTNPAEYT